MNQVAADNPDHVRDEEESAIPPELWESIPPENRRLVIRAVSTITQISGPNFNPALRQVTSEHITQLINNSEAQSNRDAEADKSTRRYQFLYFIVALAALLFLLIFFTIREQYELLAAVITGAMGFGSGFGIGKFTNRR